jgi:alpha-tubulin suppressor-like RCC1 family protein
MATMVAACGDDSTTTDGGGSDSGGTDSGMMMTDGGRTDGGRPDGGPTGCTEGCAWVEVQAGLNHSCARRENGSLRCWGGNVYGQLGDGSMRHQDCGSAGSTEPQDCAAPVDVRVVDDATQLSSHNGFSTCALRASGEVFCWGLQSVPPSVGSDAMPRRFTPELREGFSSITELSDGFLHTCGVSAGSAVCIGVNNSGQIGNDDTMEVRVAYTLPTPTGFVDIEAAGHSDFTCGRTADAVFCWGSNADLQLGDGVADHADNCVTGGAVDYDCSLTPVEVALPKGVTFTSLSLGGAHACAVGSDGALYCWGANNYGQLGLGDNTSVGVPTAVPGLTNVEQVATGDSFTCARTSDGAVWCWGDNQEGSLGDGSMSHAGCTSPMATDCSASPVQVMGIDDADDIGAGYRHACAVRASGTEIWCWGWNDRKQLGDTTRDRRNTPVQVMAL